MSIQSTSVRGVMMPRTGRSPRRMTPEIMSRSSGSITPALAASATTVRISSSVTALAGASRRPSRRNTRPVEASNSQTTGPMARESSVMGRATAQAMPSGERTSTRPSLS